MFHLHRSGRYAFAAAAALGCAPLAQAQTVVYPTLPHAASNVAPFNITNAPGITHHQVYASYLFANLFGGAPVRIDEVAFAPTSTVNFDSHVVIRLGYTQVVPPAAPDAPVEGGGGAPNAVGPMHVLFEGQKIQGLVNSPENFEFDFSGTPFIYDPAQGNLLVEIVVTQRVIGTAASRAAGSPESTRSYTRHAGAVTISPTTALRTQFTVAQGEPPCYANCDGSTVEPVLNVDDFTCFINEFAAAITLPHEQQVEHYANCDGSTVAPALNVDDFTCFINQFAQGCL